MPAEPADSLAAGANCVRAPGPTTGMICSTLGPMLLPKQMPSGFPYKVQPLPGGFVPQDTEWKQPVSEQRHGFHSNPLLLFSSESSEE